VELISHDKYINASVRHTIIMLTYNQESLIKNALDSILTQNVLPFEIIIGDDASSDNTYAIIIEYQKLYPKIIKAFQHKKNIGIFPNQNFLMKKVTGDIVSFLAGDDVFKPGLLYELNKVIVEDEINLENDFVIVTNASSIDLSGREIIFDNFKFKHKNPFKQRIRYSINYRAVGISASLLGKVGPVIEDIGYHADWIWCLRIDNLSKKHYYTSFVSSEYHTGIGLVSQTKKYLLSESMLKVIAYIKEEFKDLLDDKDLLYLKLISNYENYQIKPSLKNYLIYLYYLILNISNLDSNNHLMNYKNLIPKQILSKLVFLKSMIKT
jgi:glycosyltransferase involved in cell wall biosynthesis